MILPHGEDWIVVQRKSDDTRNSGEIVRHGLSKAAAERVAEWLNSLPASAFTNTWAMPRTDY